MTNAPAWNSSVAANYSSRTGGSPMFSQEGMYLLKALKVEAKPTKKDPEKWMLEFDFTCTEEGPDQNKKLKHWVVYTGSWKDRDGNERENAERISECYDAMGMSEEDIKALGAEESIDISDVVEEFTGKEFSCDLIAKQSDDGKYWNTEVRNMVSRIKRYTPAIKDGTAKKGLPADAAEAYARLHGGAGASTTGASPVQRKVANGQASSQVVSNEQLADMM